MEINFATPDDIPNLCELLGHLFDQETEFSADKSAQIRGLSAIIANPTMGLIFVARDKGRTVGMANLLFTISTALGATVGILEDVVVTPEYRSRGIGKQLLRSVKSYCQEHNIARITLLTDRDNAAAQRFYAGQGFSRSSMVALRHLT